MAASFSPSADDDLGPLWRDDIRWDQDGYTEVLTELRTREAPRRLLFVGMCQAGKSSSINTFMSGFQGKRIHEARSAVSAEAVTYTLDEYPLHRDFLVAYDTQGIESSQNPDEECCGPSVIDLRYIMDGQIQPGYKFGDKDGIPFSDKHYLQQGRTKIDMVVFVMDITTVLPHSVVNMMGKIMDVAKEKGIPSCILGTKCDLLSSHVGSDVTKLFRSTKVKEYIDSVGETMKMDPAFIFPMVNFSPSLPCTGGIDIQINCLALNTLKNILAVADSNPTTYRETSYILPSPWRKVNDNLHEEQPLKYLKNFSVDRVDDINCVLFGLKSAGKTQLINSILSVLYGYQVNFLATGKRQEPITTKLEKHTLEKSGGTRLPISIWDTMGFSANGQGMHLDYVKPIINGYIEHSEALSPHSGVAQCEAVMSLKDQVHCAVLVIDCSSFSELDEADIKILYETRMMISSKGIPCIVIATQCDELCPLVRENPKHVHRSSRIKEEINEIKTKLQVPVIDIIPVVCNPDQDVSEVTSELLLDSLVYMCKRAKDYIDRQPVVPKETHRGLWAAFWGK